MNIGYHRVPGDLLAALATGEGDSAAAGTLSAAQYSKHAILLNGVVTAAAASGHQQTGLARRGFDLLASVQRHDPGTANALIRHPAVGAWAYRTMAGLRGGPVVPGATPGRLAAVGIAAAIRAGLPAQIEVPVIEGTVMLPTLGAIGPVDADVATVRTTAGHTEVAHADGSIVLPGDLRARASGWRPLQPLLTAPFELTMDDIDPFRMPAAPHLAPAGDLAHWRPVFREAWALLDRHHPGVAAEVAALITVIVPLASPPRGQVSSSSPETFGAIAMSQPADACTLAVTLAHEVQHVKLSALIDLIRLTYPDDNCRYYAPWRGDPRPVSGLLQGTYAYLGITGFWRRQRELEPGMAAHTEFARWREAVALAAGTLQSSGRLTAAGQDFVRGMASTLHAWQADEVPQAAARRARAEGRQHLLRWQAEHGVEPGAIPLWTGMDAPHRAGSDLR